jgi:hypothetical protein
MALQRLLVSSVGGTSGIHSPSINRTNVQKAATPNEGWTQFFAPAFWTSLCTAHGLILWACNNRADTVGQLQE